MDGGAWWAAVHGVAKSLTRLRDFTFAFAFQVNLGTQNAMEYKAEKAPQSACISAE